MERIQRPDILLDNQNDGFAEIVQFPATLASCIFVEIIVDVRKCCRMWILSSDTNTDQCPAIRIA